MEKKTLNRLIILGNTTALFGNHVFFMRFRKQRRPTFSLKVLILCILFSSNCFAISVKSQDDVQDLKIVEEFCDKQISTKEFLKRFGKEIISQESRRKKLIEGFANEKYSISLLLVLLFQYLLLSLRFLFFYYRSNYKWHLKNQVYLTEE